MLKYNKVEIVTQEVPGEVSLAIYFTNCPFHCPYCKHKELREDEGRPLTMEELDMYIDSASDQITCVAFMGGDVASNEVDDLAAHIRCTYPELKIAWYSGADELTVFTQLKNFDFIKLGKYNHKLGDLKSKTTNQRLFEVKDGVLKNITSLFW